MHLLIIRYAALLGTCLAVYPVSGNNDSSNDYIVDQLSVSDGLSHNEITTVIQDQLGFIWMGTRGGLNRYDGYSFLKFKPDPENISNSIISTSIEKIFEDSRGNIWIGTKSGGISRYSLQEEAFTNFKYEKDDPTSLSDQRVISFFEDDHKRIWIGTWSGGLNLYDYSTNTFTRYLPGDNVGSVTQTRDGRIWAATYHGIWFYSEQEDRFNKISLPVDYMRYEWVRIAEDPLEAALWIGGWECGVLKYNYQDGRIKEFDEIKNKEETLNNVYSLLIDTENNLWAGTWGQGLYMLDRKKEVFIEFELQPDEEAYSANQVVLDLFQDKDQCIWVGTNGNGVFRISDNRYFHNYLQTHQDVTDWLRGTDIGLIQRDEQDRFWLGSSRKGLFFIDKNGNFRKVSHKTGTEINKTNVLYRLHNGSYWIGFDGSLAELKWPGNDPLLYPVSELYNNPQLEEFSKITTIIQKGDTIWIGTQQNGLLKLLLQGNRIKVLSHYTSDLTRENWLRNNRITCLMADASQQIWVGTYHGLYLIKDDSSFVNINNKLPGNRSLTSEIILDLAQDENGNIWLGTPNGLNCIKKQEKGMYSLEYYDAGSGLSGDYINALLIEGSDNIWVSNNIGISKIDLKKGEINNFFESEGIHVRKFTEKSAYKDGEIFHFGGFGGIVTFDPKNVKLNRRIPEIVFTEFQINNKELEVGEEFNNHVLLNKSINYIDKITLAHDENDISLGISVLDYNAPERNSYAYKMEGLEDGWVNLGNRHWIAFNNLKPGEYRLHVKGANNNNIWNLDGIELHITVRPPWWLTQLAFFIYASVILGIVLVIRFIAVRQERLSRNIEILQIKSDQEKEINEMKLRFFTNISHEFKTPLTMILCPLQEILSGDHNIRIPEILSKKLLMIRRNATQLLDLINQIIDLRKIDTGNMQVDISQTDLKEFIREISISYEELARINHKTFHAETHLQDRLIWTDKSKLETIINNLISNSFKYTSEGGKIILKASDNEDHFIIEVTDDGKGISEENISKVFDRYFQEENNTGKSSSGIGLAIVKQLVEILQGEIEVESRVGVETRFRIILKKGKDHLSDGASEITKIAPAKFRKLELASRYMPVPGKIKKQKTSDHHLIMIVEDEDEMREYLDQLLSGKFKVKTASDGEEGYQKVLEHKPDLVISDIMMPNVDGFELCERIKNNPVTEDIPVILLTAKSADQFKILGTRMGADDYISKPFDTDYLTAKVVNMLNARKMLKEHYAKKIKLEPRDVEINDHQKELIEKAIRIIEQNIDRPELNAQFLAEQLHYSQSTLYRNLKRITGQSITRFIRTIRLKRAAQLLKDEDKTISQIAYEVGFSDIKYFRKNFEKEFNVAPRKYRKSIDNQ